MHKALLSLLLISCTVRGLESENSKTEKDTDETVSHESRPSVEKIRKKRKKRTIGELLSRARRALLRRHGYVNI